MSEERVTYDLSTAQATIAADKQAREAEFARIVTATAERLGVLLVGVIVKREIAPGLFADAVELRYVAR